MNISAPTARVPLPYLAALSGSKAALSAMSDALRLELSGWNIPVIVVEPGATDTRIFAKAEAAATISLRSVDPGRVALYERQLAAIAAASARQRTAPVDPVAGTIAAAVGAPSQSATTPPAPRRAWQVSSPASPPGSRNA